MLIHSYHKGGLDESSPYIKIVYNNKVNLFIIDFVELY